MWNLMSTLGKAAAITALILFGMSGAAAETAELPAADTDTWSAELVAFDDDFVDTIQVLEPGQCVTAKSPHAAWDRNAVVLDIRDIRGFTDVGNCGADLVGTADALPRKVIQSTQFIDIESFNDIG